MKRREFARTGLTAATGITVVGLPTIALGNADEKRAADASYKYLWKHMNRTLSANDLRPKDLRCENFRKKRGVFSVPVLTEQHGMIRQDIRGTEYSLIIRTKGLYGVTYGLGIVKPDEISVDEYIQSIKG